MFEALPFLLLLLAQTLALCPEPSNFTVEYELRKNEFLRRSAARDLSSFRDAYAIYVNGQNLPRLCRGFARDFSNLALLELVNDNVEVVESGAFGSLSGRVHLDFNRLREVRVGVFNGLNLAGLSLTDNLIEFVEDGAFDNMTHLEAISLSFNRIKTWSSAWFHNTPLLSSVHFSYNEIETLPEKSLGNLQGKRTNLDLSHNKITELHPEAFAGVTYFGKLNLSGNRIKSVAPGLFSNVKKILEVNLSWNDVTCLFDDELASLKNVSVVKLQGNPLGRNCWGLIERLVERERLVVVV